MSDPRKANFRWGDAEVDGQLQRLATFEQELLKQLANIPENTPHYKKKAEKLNSIIKQWVELEKMLFNRADFDQYYKEKVIDDQKWDNLAQWLWRDIMLFWKEGESIKYDPQEGFLVYFDYILNLIKEFKKVQIVYGIYNWGSTVFEPRLVDLTWVNDTTHPNFSQVIYDINHWIWDVEPHPDTMFIFEI